VGNAIRAFGLCVRYDIHFCQYRYMSSHSGSLTNGSSLSQGGDGEDDNGFEELHVGDESGVLCCREERMVLATLERAVLDRESLELCFLYSKAYRLGYAQYDSLSSSCRDGTSQKPLRCSNFAYNLIPAIEAGCNPSIERLG
jgi:hypothetical protein